ncbi:MAG: hypothetical protein QGI42_07485, partial [Rhodospirillales bacterium]|nr:hypothetical protein [Rhodospirillales bacterium]
ADMPVSDLRLDGKNGHEVIRSTSISDRNRINESPSSLPPSWPDLIRPSTDLTLGINRVDTRLKAGHDNESEVTRLFCDEP